MNPFAEALKGSIPHVPAPANDAPEVELLFDPMDHRALTIAAMIEPPPKRAAIIENLIYRAIVALLAGPGGTGKDTLARVMSCCCGTGANFMGLKTTKCRVVYFGSEDEQSELFRGLYYEAQKYSPHERELIAQNVFIKSLTGTNCRMTDTKQGMVMATGFAQRIAATVQAVGDVGLIIFSTISRANGGDENSAADMTMLVEQFELIAQTTNAAVLLLHHTPKASMRDSDRSQAAVRGSSAIVDGARSVLLLNRPDEKEARHIPKDELKNYIVLSHVKSNYSALADDIWMKRGLHGVLSQTTPPGPGRVADGGPDPVITKIADLVRDYARTGRLFSQRSFVIAHFGDSGSFGLSKDKLTAKVEEAIHLGVIEQRPVLKGSGYHLHIPASKNDSGGQDEEF
ncbi:AAA family ATPase [Candidatus Magnetaquicoccus inordinatus]|uniref:AAA family ATPase n=1 Tax=Candidatus Magnetaquicoccus inordinatus TaxID=2496818 RepID=UPI00187D431E|nr:AAA family ATPase [Candidatus Magnetaquicoccus inordinatus]